MIDSGRISLSGFAFGTFRPGDALRGRLSATPDMEQSRATNVQYSTPIGNNGLSLTLAGAYQETRPSSVDISGEASVLSANVSYPVILDFKRELSLSATVDRLESTNTALGSVITNERISAARFGAKGGWTGKTRSLQGILTYSRGLGLDEARSAVPGASTEFDKIEGTGKLVQAIGRSFFVRMKHEASGAKTSYLLTSASLSAVWNSAAVSTMASSASTKAMLPPLNQPGAR